MPNVDSYAPGTPSWIDLGSPDLDASIAFYGGLFGWVATEAGPAEETGGYRMFSLEGRVVAGLGPQQAPGPPYWTTYIAVTDVDVTSAKVAAAGGKVIMPPMDVMTAGRMAVFADPEGAVFSVWQAGEHHGAQVVNEPGTLIWNELTCRQPDQAKTFYGAVFGWKANEVDSGGNPYTEWLLDGKGVGGMMPMIGDQWPGPDVMPAHWMVYFAVADTDAAAARCAELGGQVPVPPTDIPPGRFAVLNDPQGAHFSVIKMAASAS
jgi:predicted enzyme related to lactoylglutathione lyase